MIKIEHLETWGFEHAIRGLRNPMNSWDKLDSIFKESIDFDPSDYPGNFILGPNDLKLMRKLYSAGTSHRKFMRQIFISMDITAPLYWWKEFDTYKVGTVANSCSTMHKITEKEFELDDFSHEHLDVVDLMFKTTGVLTLVINALNTYREAFLSTKNKDYWWQIIQLLPSSYNQKRTITMSYENAAAIIEQRSGHKLDEWNILIGILHQDVPYLQAITEDPKTVRSGCVKVAKKNILKENDYE